MRKRIVTIAVPAAVLALSLAGCDTADPAGPTSSLGERPSSLPALDEYSGMAAADGPTTVAFEAVSSSEVADGACTAVFDKPVYNAVDRGAYSQVSVVGETPQQLADEFVLTSDAGIQRVTWAGSYHIFDLPTSTAQVDFRIRLFEDAGGVPEPVPFHDELVTALVAKAGVFFDGHAIYLVEADLASEVALSGGVTYWISILEEDPSTDWYAYWWRWANSTTVAGDMGAMRLDDGGSWNLWGGTRASQSFQLQACQSEPEDPEVEVDIKPGSDENPVNLRSKGNIPVAILTTDDFDAGTVDPSTVTLGNNDGADTPVAARKNGSLMAGLEDVDDDGDLDLVLHFSTQELVANGDLDGNTTELTLNGGTTDGLLVIHGSDTVTIVPH